MPNNALLQNIAQGPGYVSPPELNQFNQQNQLASQRNTLFNQGQQDREQEQKLMGVRNDLASYIIARKQSPQAAQQTWAQLAPKYGLQDQDPEAFVPDFIRKNPGVLGKASEAVLADFLAPQASAMTAAEREAAAYANDPNFRKYVDRPMRTPAAINMGGYVQTPQGRVDKTLPPQNQPENQRAAAEAKAAGTAAGELAGEQDKKEYNAGEALVVLDEIEKLLPFATGSGAGAAVDATARFFGQTTEGAAAAKRLKVLAPQLILKVPRMEGPQSDKDTMLYREAAGNLGDETSTTGERMAALQTLRMLTERYAPLNQGAAPQQPAGLPPDVSEEDIQETMRVNNMTREQVLEAIGGR